MSIIVFYLIGVTVALVLLKLLAERYTAISTVEILRVFKMSLWSWVCVCFILITYWDEINLIIRDIFNK